MSEDAKQAKRAGAKKAEDEKSPSALKNESSFLASFRSHHLKLPL